MSKAFEIFNDTKDILRDNLPEDNIKIFTDILNTLKEDFQNNSFAGQSSLTFQLTIQEIFATFRNLNILNDEISLILNQLRLFLGGFSTNSQVENFVITQIQNFLGEDTNDTTNNNSVNNLSHIELTAPPSINHNDTNTEGNDFYTNMLRIRANSDLEIYGKRMSFSYGKISGGIGKFYNNGWDGDHSI